MRKTKVLNIRQRTQQNYPSIKTIQSNEQIKSRRKRVIQMTQSKKRAPTVTTKSGKNTMRVCILRERSQN